MAKNFRGEGINMDFPGVTIGATLTAGSMVFVVGTAQTVTPFTSVAATALAESSGFFGVLAETYSATHTGVTIHRRGVFEFMTLTASTAAAVLVGRPVWAASHDTVRGFGTTATTLTGFHPIGVCVGLPGGPDLSGTSVRCLVDIRPDRTMSLYLGESGNATP